jgi:predicted transcriptional regulator
MSPRAAWRLQDLGFERVYDYVPGKADWFASGLPREGNLASIPTVGDVARPEVPTCSPKEKASNARERTRGAGWDTCVVVNEERVVFGLVRIKEELESDPAATVEEVMVAGPTTYRPNVPVGKAVERMRKRGVPAVLVTTSDGRLIGQLYREDAERQTENLQTSENSSSTHSGE